MKAAEVTLVPWADTDLPLLERLGGPETPAQIRQRHQRYLQLPETDHMFTIVLDDAAEPVCRKLRFELLEECGFEYPPGHPMTVNHWRLDLFS